MRCFVFIALCLLCTLLQGSGSVYAGTRRAVLVGINHYQVNPKTDRATDLDGATNDLAAMVQVLRTFHGFLDKDIHILKDQEATRQRILQTFDTYLLRPAAPDDISLFYFAGHGSYVDNSASSELDRRDETIVPADTNRGVPDIRDKELAQRFNQVLDKQAGLVAIFDSCHSGSIARGLPDLAKNRYAPPARVRAVPSPSVVGAPEERGAVIISAAQDQQPAQERYILGQPHGRFTSALEQVLSGPFRDESVENIFLRVRSLMQIGGSVQEPVLATTGSRRTQTLWGAPPLEQARRATDLLVAVGRITSTRVYLQGGHAHGIGVQAELSSERAQNPVRLRIAEVLGMSTSMAEVVGGSVADVRPGDLFHVDTLGTPPVEGLHIYSPKDAPSRQALSMVLTVLAKLQERRQVVWIQDPTEMVPTHVIAWQKGQWVLRAADGHLSPLGASLKGKRLLPALRGAQKPRLFVSLPFPAEDRTALAAALASGQGLIDLVDQGAGADYWLAGRLLNGGVQFAYVQPQVQQGNKAVLLPVRSPWTDWTEKTLGDLLLQDARRFGRIKIWQHLETPQGDNRFPYRLAVRQEATQQLLPEGTPMLLGHDYHLVLVLQNPLPRVQPRYVYVFSIDRDGNSALLVPPPSRGNVENLFPDRRNRDNQPPPIIPIGDPITIKPPLGRDTLVLVTSESGIANPEIFSFSSGRTAPILNSAGADALSQFLFGLNTGTRGMRPLPATWSVQRIDIESVDR